MDEGTAPTPADFSDEKLRPSIETDYYDDVTQKEVDGTSSEEVEEHYERESSYADRSEPAAEGESHKSDSARKSGDGDEAADEDVFNDESPRSSMGSYDAGSDSSKGVEADNMTTITHSSRISASSQYDKEDFSPTSRETPRPPLRTASDVRTMRMSSPSASVISSPRSSRKQLSTSRLGTPSASAQYSPKRMSTPPRFRSSRQDAPLVLLHVTLLPLRWMWGDVVNNLDPAEMSDEAKRLRTSWRMLQDRVGDTVIERGVLLGHPQNDYEVLEERLLEALDLPVRRRAMILECGHYLGPSNEATLVADEESEDDDGQERRRSGPRRRWCATCKSEIRYEPPSDAKMFRVKVYASNGLMRAGAWEACWKEMERVDVELEPAVEPAVQDEIVRLAASQQERDIAQQEEAEIAKEVALQYEEQRRAQAQSASSSPSSKLHGTPQSSASRRRRDEERLREIYGKTPPPASHAHESSPQRNTDSYSSPPRSHSPPADENEQKGIHPSENQSASLPTLLLQSLRVLAQDRRNVIIAALSAFVLVLALRSAHAEPPYEPIIHVMKATPQMRQMHVADAPRAVPVREEQGSVEVRGADLGFQTAHYGNSEASFLDSFDQDDIIAPSETAQPGYPRIEDEACPSLEKAQIVPPLARETVTASSGNWKVYCNSPRMSASAGAKAGFVDFDGEDGQWSVWETIHETVHGTAQDVETITEKVVKVIHTVTQTQTEDIAVETAVLQATETALVEEESTDGMAENVAAENECAAAEPGTDSEPDCIAEPVLESGPGCINPGEFAEAADSLPDCIVEPAAEGEEVPTA